MINKIFIVFCCLFGFNPIYAGEEYKIPVQKIVGLEVPVAKGELVDLSLSKIETKPDNLVSSVETWTILEFKDGEVLERRFREYMNRDGTTGVFFGSGVVNKKMHVICNVTYLFVEKDKTDTNKITKVVGKSVSLSGTLTIGDGNSPVNPVNPVDPVTPVVLPEGKFGLAKFVFDSINKNVTREKQAISLEYVKVYESVVAAVGAGVIKDPEALLKEVSKGVSLIDGINRNKEQWSKVSDDVQERLYALYKDNKLKTVRDFADSLNELTIGLKAVK